MLMSYPGLIPPALGNLKKLTVLSLSNNQLIGEIGNAAWCLAVSPSRYGFRNRIPMRRDGPLRDVTELD